MTPLTPGLDVDRYRLLRRLGRGSFAEVWLAEERGALGFRRRLALKILEGPEEDRRLEGLFLEARVCAAIAHPNVVDVHVIGHTGELWWVAMELVEGGDLKALIRRVAKQGLRFPASVVIDIGLDIARGLAAAHAATGPDGEPLPIVHRDLKPANVLIHPTGLLKVTDFGIAKVTSEGTMTARGMTKGTHGYMAPEIWGGSRDFRPRVDLFALGCILYQVVVLEKLFSGPWIDIARTVLERTAREEAARVRARLPALGDVVEDLLQRDPELRYQDAGALEQDLASLRRSCAGAELRDFLVLLQAVEGEGPPPGLSDRLRAAVLADGDWRELWSRAGGAPVREEVPVTQRPEPKSRPRRRARRRPPSLARSLSLGFVLASGILSLVAMVWLLLRLAGHG